MKNNKLIQTLVFILLTLHISAPAHADTADQRQIVKLNKFQQAHVLTEMRAMLSGTQAILAALAAEDMAAVAWHARLLGMNMGQKAENTLHQALPREFMQLGMSVHQAFDRIAADAETLKDAKHSLQQVSAALNTCNACHDVYQIQAGDAKGKR